MKVMFCSDVHVGNHQRHGGAVVLGLNRRCCQVIAVLAEAARRARDRDSTLVILGDMFDSHVPEPQVIAAVQRAIAAVPVIVLVGNHEQVSMGAGDNSLAPLGPVASVQEEAGVVEVDGGALLMVPFRVGRAGDWLPDVVAELAGKVASGVRKVLCLHLGIRDQQTPPWLSGAPDAIDVEDLATIMEQHGIQNAFAGNWHWGKTWRFPRATIVQCGALVPAGFRDEGLVGFGGLYSFGGPGGVQREEVAGPRFLKLRGRVAVPQVPPGTLLYCERTVGPEDADAFQAGAASDVEAGVVQASAVLLDRGEQEAAARTAAYAAKSAATPDQALAEFVAAMPLPDELDRQAVTTRVGQYLTRARC